MTFSTSIKPGHFSVTAIVAIAVFTLGTATGPQKAEAGILGGALGGALIGGVIGGKKGARTGAVVGGIAGALDN